MQRLSIKRTYAFTIVELIIVIAVIGILAAISLIGYSNYQKNAKLSQYEADATAIIKKAEAIASEGVSTAAYPKARSDFPTTASAHKLPSGVNVVFTASGYTAVENTTTQATNTPADNTAIVTALTLVSSDNHRVYTLKSCANGAGVIVYYPDPKNSSTANAAVKSYTAGNVTSC